METDGGTDDRKKVDGRAIRSPQSLEGNEEVLPGLPNDVVLHHMVPKLPWRAFHFLSSVSLSWLDAIQSRQVYDARVRFKKVDSFEKLLVLNHTYYPDVELHAMSLYSLMGNSWHLLPKFPFYKEGIPQSCRCVALEGRLYVLGGKPHRHYSYYGDYDDRNSEDSDGRPQVPNTGCEVFVLDLVGQSAWRRCSDLPEPRFDFACGILDGKVYVLGGYTGRAPDWECTSECLVYDPKEDRWSSIVPMTSKRNSHHAVAVGNELWVHGGEFGRGHTALYAEMYNPAKDEWDRAKDEWDHAEPQRYHVAEHLFRLKRKPYLFTIEGKPYLISTTGIYVREGLSERKTRWTRLHSFTAFSDISSVAAVVAAQALGDELVALLACRETGKIITLFRTKGFGTEKDVIQVVFDKSGAFCGRQWQPHLMCHIEL